MKIGKLYVFPFFIILFICSCKDLCTKTVDCPAFSNTAFFKWFPYASGQVLVFKNSIGDMEQFIIDSVGKSEAYEHTYSINYSKSYSCNTDALIKGYGIYIVYGTTDTIMKIFTLDFKNMQIAGADINETGIVDMPHSYGTEYEYGYSVGGKVYDTVQKIFVRDTAALMGIDTLYIGKHYGIIGYSVYPGSAKWTIQ